MIRKYGYVFVLLFLTAAAEAQEFIATVRVTAPTLQLADPKILQQLQNRVEEFMNTNQWTKDDYLPHEKIKLNLQITISKDVSVNNFLVDLGIQATRPVYESTYETPIFSHLDRDLAIVFEEFKPITATQNNFNDNLSSILSYYAYLVLGLDRDSFSPSGGEEYFRFCQEIVNSVPPAMADLDKGWANPRDIRTRYYIIDNLLNPRMKLFRQGFYEYHRKGLDLMTTNIEEAKKNMASVITDIDDLNTKYPNTFIIQIFANTKAAEITNIFQVGEQKERFDIYTKMSRIDPANSQKYEAIRRG